MTIPSVAGANYPTQDETRATLLRAISYAFSRRGIQANVLPGSDHYIRADKFAGRVSIAVANNQLALADSDPLTAVGAPLITLSSVFGVVPRAAGAAAGSVLIVTTGTVTIPAGFQATASNGKKYQTPSMGTYVNGAAVALVAVDGGTDTNQAAGAKLTWDSAALGLLSPTCTVDSGGLTGGVPADDDERLRARLLQRLAYPPVGGNWSEVVGWAEDSTSSVQAAYCFPAVRGPASYDVAVTKAGGDRSLPAPTLSIVRGYIAGRMPGQNDLVVTSVTAEYVDVVVAALLPLPQAAGGAGGGWRDPSPWPAENALVTAYNSGTATATVATTATPLVGSSIGIWDPTADNGDGTFGRMREYVVSVVGGGVGAWTIKVQGDFVVTPLGAYVSAGAVSLVQYASTFAAALALLGPGEKTSSPEILPRGRREPATDVTAPSAITSIQLASVTNAYREVGGLEYMARYATGTTTPRTSPSLPAASADPPNIIVLKYLAIRAA